MKVFVVFNVKIFLTLELSRFNFKSSYINKIILEIHKCRQSKRLPTLKQKPLLISTSESALTYLHTALGDA